MGLSDTDLERLRATLAHSTFVDRFAVTREAGAGGMGRVYDAVERDSGRRVAIKVLTDRAAAGNARFDAEVEILERLNHPMIVAYIGHGVTDAGEPYLAMTWLDGESLATRLAREPALTVAEAVTIGVRIAQALVYAHAEGVVHRDIKPSNVFLVDGEADHAMLIDFGVAKDTAVARDLTHTGEVLGTPGYMAPEQVMGRADLDGRADLFALGCLLHEALAGRPPFDGTEVMVVLARLLLHDPPRLGTIRPDVPARLDTLIAALLAKQPEHRLADADLVADELAVIAAALASGDAATLAETPIAVPPPTNRDAATVLGGARPAIPAPRRAALIAGGLVLAAAAVVIAVAVIARRDPDVARQDPVASGVCTERDFSGCDALCTSGTAEACRMLGVALVYGRRGHPVDTERGRALLDRGCRGGDGNACVSLALHLRAWLAKHPGEGSAADWTAVLDRGCTAKFALACEQLARAYDGEFRAAGEPRPDALAIDPAQATTYYERACALTGTAACVELAHRLRAGTGTPPEPARADRVLNDSCDRGHRAACDEVGR